MNDFLIMAIAAKLRTTEPIKIDAKQIACVAEAVYHESRSEPLSAQIGVASTVLNRGKPCDVVREKHQFAYRKRKDLKPSEENAWRQSLEIATLVSVGAVQKYDATHFVDESVKPEWTRGLEYIGKSGKLKFWRKLQNRQTQN